jgi:zinc protease
MKLAIAIPSACALAALLATTVLASDYAVVVSARTAENPAWRQVADTLLKRHSAELVLFTNAVDETLPALQKQFPRYACFVARPEEVTKEFVAKIHRLTRRFDDDPYTDCFWGILTGYDAANALAIAKQEQPLTIHKVASGTELAMDMVEEGVWYCELNKNKSVRKSRGGSAETIKCADDTTECLVRALNDEQPDLFVTSGHATEHDWMIGYRYKNGFFKHQDGRLFGEDTQKHKLAINSTNPKVYLPIGNCLMGHIDKPDCMATSWMNSAGVCQMLGYTEVTWYGYAGWGVLDYFVEQPGRYTFAEAFFANQHALIHRLTTCFPDAASESAKTAGKITDAGRAAGLTANDGRGLLYDRDIVAFYGDPAWSARMADLPKAFEQRLTEEKGTFTFEIKPNRGANSFKPVNTNGAQRGGRPFVAYLPRRVRDVKITGGAELNPIITDDFMLVPNPGVFDPGKTYKVVFTARPML